MSRPTVIVFAGPTYGQRAKIRRALYKHYGVRNVRFVLCHDDDAELAIIRLGWGIRVGQNESGALALTWATAPDAIRQAVGL